LLDVGCGSGQATNIFQLYFKKILGIDINLEQIKQAKKQNSYDNIRYLEGSAENLPAQDGTVDLVLAATAVHWFDLPKFYQEVKRVLKPNTGCLAIIGYTCPSANLLSNPNEHLKQKSFQFTNHFIDKLIANQPAVQPAFAMCNSRYDNIFKQLPFKTKIRDDSFHLYNHGSLVNYCQILSSLDVYESYMEEKRNALKERFHEITEEMIARVDPLQHHLQELLDLWQLEDDCRQETLFKIEFHPFILLAR